MSSPCIPVPYSTATALAQFLNTPQDIGVDASNVYWTDTGDNTVWSVAKTGGTPVQLASGQSNPAFLALDDTYVYWINAAGTSINRVPKSGGGVMPVVTTSAAPMGIAVDATKVYWADAASFYSVDKGGGTSTLVGTPTNPAMNLPAPGRLVMSGGTLAVSDGSKIWSPTGVTHQSFTQIYFPVGASATDLWWARSGPSTYLESSGFEIGIVLGAPAHPLDLVVDSCAVYYVTGNGIAQVPLASGLALYSREVALGANARHLAIDEAYVYWTDGRSILKAAK
jgi:hypothetical protein